jgi:hypothetical protein
LCRTIILDFAERARRELEKKRLEKETREKGKKK